MRANPSLPFAWGDLRAVALLVLISMSPGVSGETAASLVAGQLERMAHAMRSLNYDGTFVHLHDNRMEAMRVIHLVRDGREREQLISLNGAERGVTRDPQGVTCTLPDRAAIAISKGEAGQKPWFSRDADPEVLERNYLLHPLGEARVAGRQADVVGIIPRDNFRYGYRLFIDKEVGLLLQSDLMDESAQPIEQIMFTSLTLNPDLDFEPAEPASDAMTWTKGEAADPAGESRDTSLWSFEGLPSGFDLKLRDTWQDETGRPVDHFLLSDGLASMSVYIESAEAEGLTGSTRMGAISAWGGTVSGHQVTVVGEVPLATAKKVFSALRRQ